MRTVKFVLLLIALSLVPAQPALGQDNQLPFNHTACADGVDLTGQTVSLYHIANPNDQGVIIQALRASYADAAEYFNAHGGICGATLAQVFDDTAGASNQNIYDRFAALDPKPLAVTLYSSDDSIELASKLATDEIPGLLLRGGSIESVYGKDGQTLGWAFATSPLYVDQVGSVCDYIAAHPDEFSRPVIGFIINDDSWARRVVQDAHPYCESLGIGYAGVAAFFDDSIYSPAPVQTLINAGANILYTNQLKGGPAELTRILAEMKLKNPVRVAAVNWVMDSDTYYLGDKKLDADGLPYTNGIIGSLPLRSWSEVDNPGIQLITQQADLHNRPRTMRSDAYLMGWKTSDLFIETYIETGNRVGFKNITGADIKETLENIVYAPMGGVEKIDYQGGKRRALAENRIGEIGYLGQDGKTLASATNPPMVDQEDNQQLIPIIVPLTDYQTAPDLRPGGTDAPHP